MVKLNGKDLPPAYVLCRALVAPLLLHYFFKMAYFVATPAISYHRRTWRQVYILLGAGALNLVGNAAVIAALAPHSMTAALAGVASVTILCYALAMLFGFMELRKLYPGVLPGTGFIAALGLLVALPLTPLAWPVALGLMICGFGGMYVRYARGV